MPQVPLPGSRDMARNLTRAGLLFVTCGILAILLPAWATLAAEQLIAVFLLLWGAGGLGFGLSLRPHPDWRMTTGLYLMILALGTIFLAVPRDGIATMTMLLTAVFLIQGSMSISLGLGLRGHAPTFRLVILSGLVSLALGLVILTGWPGTVAWTLGMVTGLNLVTTGATLIAMGRNLDRKSQP